MKNKKTIIKSISYTGALLSMLGTTVFAETPVNTTATTPTDTSTTTPVANTGATTSTVAPVTQTQVSDAKAELNTAQTAVDAQQAVVNTTNTTVSTAQAGVTTAQTDVANAQALANEATPTNIANAQTGVSTAQTGVSTAQTGVSTAQTGVATAQTGVNTAQAGVATAQTGVNTAQAGVATAQNDVATKQAILDGTGASAIIAKAEQTQATQDQAQAVVDQAVINLANAQKADAQRQATINADKTAVSTATTNLTNTTNALSTATSQATTAQNNLANATTAFTTAQNDYNGINTITLTSDYVKYLTQYYNSYYGTPEYTEAIAQLKAMNSTLESMNTYKANLNDSKALIDTNNLSSEQLKELTFFGQDLINQIRKQFGTPETVATIGAINFADAITDGYVSDDWSWAKTSTSGHDNTVINSVAKSLNLDYDATNAGQYYENMHSIGTQMKQVSMADAKKLVYNAINRFMFNGFEWLHAQSIAGLMSGGKTDYIGIDVSDRTGVTGVHVELVNAGMINSGSTFDTTPLTNTKTAQAVTNTYNQAKATLANATTANTTAQSNLSNATTANNQAKATLATAQAKLASDTAIPLQTPTAQQALDTANANLTTAKAENAKAQQAVLDLNADIQAKTKALNNAKAVLAQKQAVLDSANKDLANAEAILAQRQAELAQAQQALKDAQAKLASSQVTLNQAETHYQELINAPERLNQAQQALADAQKALDVALLQQKVDQAKLDTLIATRNEKQAIYDDLLARYNAQLETQRLAELEAKRQEIIASGNVATPIYDETGKVVDYVVGNQGTSVTIVNNLTYNSRGYSNAKLVSDNKGEKNLPKTSDYNDSNVVLGAIMMLVATAGVTLKKKEDSK